MSAGRVDLVAAVDDRGALTTVDAHGGFRDNYAVPGVVFGFPAWSPDGSQIAVVGDGANDAAIYVFNVDRWPGAPGLRRRRRRLSELGPPGVLPVLDPRRPSHRLPDRRGQRARPARRAGRRDPAFDGERPVGDPRAGAPLYFDWIDRTRRSSTSAAGSSRVHGRGRAGWWRRRGRRSWDGNVPLGGLSQDGRYVAYATSGADASTPSWSRARRTTSRRDPRLRAVAMLFDPVGDTLATSRPEGRRSRCAERPDRTAAARRSGQRQGPDAQRRGRWSRSSGRRTGKTIAALDEAAERRTGRRGRRLERSRRRPQHGARCRESGRPEAPGRRRRSDRIGRLGRRRCRAGFIDVETGAVRSRQTVRLADHFVGQLLPYFDQYALSHRLWSPDSTSMLIPLATKAGQDQLVVMPRRRVGSATDRRRREGVLEPLTESARRSLPMPEARVPSEGARMDR